MSSCVGRALIIGGGFSGMAAAIELRKRGIEVDLVEIDTGWRSYGAGISLGGATLRALRTLGLLDAFLAKGYAGDGLTLLAPNDHVVGKVPTPRLAGPDVPGGGAIMRPALAALMAEATRASGTRVMLGTTVESLVQDENGVEVQLRGGERARYDLVVAADGIYSKTRAMLMPEVPAPRYSGQAVWRAVLPRPAEITNPWIWIGVQGVKPGVNPVSNDAMYMFITEDRPHNTPVDPAGSAAAMSALLAPFPSKTLQALRPLLQDHAQIVFRPLENLLVPRPWHRGRVVLIGDAVHATTPHLASGACIGIEDALVLAEELERSDAVEPALQRFAQRRWERCRMVVENSARLGELEIAGTDRDEQQRLIGSSMAALAQPI